MSTINQSNSESQALQRQQNRSGNGVLYGLSANAHGTEGAEQLEHMTRARDDRAQAQSQNEVETKKKTDGQLAALELPTDKSRNAAYQGAKLPEIDRRELRTQVPPVVA